MFLPNSKSLWAALLLILTQYRPAAAQSKTDGDHMHRIVVSLQQEDSMAYADLFPQADTMTALTLRKTQPGSIDYEKAVMMRENPAFLANQDTIIDKQAYELFRNFLRNGAKIGVHWHDCLLQRYELEALGKTRDAVIDAIAQERFVGYIFLQDTRTRKQYGITISEVLKIDDKWYGGELNYLFEAESKDDMKAQIRATQKREQSGIQDTAETAARTAGINEDEEQSTKRKQVLDRKLYTGMLDGEIPVVLYLRSLKGDCPETACAWDALFKFGDQDEYTRPQVSKNEQGKWVFTEEETGAVMELSLKGGVFTGSFSATTDKVDYEAQLKETPISPKKLSNLEAIIDQNKTR